MSAAVERLARAIEFLDAARVAPNGIETGAMRDAREWLEEAAREVIAEQRKADAITEYYSDRANSGQAALTGQ